MLEQPIIISYYFFFFFIFLFSIGQLALLITFLVNRNKENPFIEITELPTITIQLPIFNERFVIERLLSSIEQLNYPKSLLEIQVLDDSTDDTISIASKKIEELKNQGFNIKHIRRSTRDGYKAGALQNGLNCAKSDYIAIFDADFMPYPDFLIDTIPYFVDKETGMVQTRWGHMNPRKSLLTIAQATGLNNHFIIDQEGRNKGGYFMNFNGTGGIWKKECIIDAGGWTADTLTEDLDLSYRAQMKGWKFKYCPKIIIPSELPDRISAIRTQQFRWTKGGVETSKKLLGKLWRTELKFSIKLFGSFHLLNNYIYAFILVCGLLSFPLMYVKNTSSQLNPLFNWNILVSIVIIINFLYCFITLLVDKKKVMTAIIEVITAFPIALVISLGMSFHNTKAIIQGISGKKTAFIRTPKINGIGGNNPYLKKQSISEFLPEFFLFLFFIAAALADLYFKDFGFLLYHLLMLTGIGLILWNAYTE